MSGNNVLKKELVGIPDAKIYDVCFMMYVSRQAQGKDATQGHKSIINILQSEKDIRHS